MPWKLPECTYGLLLPETEFDELFLEIDLFERYHTNSIYYDNGHFMRTVNEYRKMIEEHTNREEVKLKDTQLLENDNENENEV